MHRRHIAQGKVSSDVQMAMLRPGPSPSNSHVFAFAGGGDAVLPSWAAVLHVFATPPTRLYCTPYRSSRSISNLAQPYTALEAGQTRHQICQCIGPASRNNNHGCCSMCDYGSIGRSRQFEATSTIADRTRRPQLTRARA